MQRKKTKKIKIGNLYIGGNAPIIVQSMTNTDTRQVFKTVKQIKNLEQAGCELVRISVPNMEAAKKIGQIKKKIKIPLAADIHFSCKTALEAINQGVDKLRINPGNIGNSRKVSEIIKLAKKNKIPIRVGVNAGSLEKKILKKHKGKATSEAMVDSALKHIKLLEKNDFKDILISLKASDIHRTIEAYRILSKKVNYPLHLGITEAGTLFRGTVVSSIGLGILLYEGIGDTIRVSLTADPVEEMSVAWEILKSLKLRKKGVTVVSCPTCARTEINLITLTEKVESEMQKINKNLTVAVMGCAVNGPGEAKEADLAIIGGKKIGFIAKKGKIIKKVAENKLLEELIKEIKKF